MIFAGLELARRLEAAEAANGTACAEAQQCINPGAGAIVEPLAGGGAIFMGAGSPLSRVIGLGLYGAVRPEELDCLERFYRERGGEVSIDLCPLADPSLLDLLGSRGYRVTEFNNVLARPLPGAGISAPAIPVSQAAEDEMDLWAKVVGCGFTDKAVLTGEEMDVGRTIFRMAGSFCYLAFIGDQPAAAAVMTIRGGLAGLFADSTLPGFRGAGLHSALIRERLRAALAAGCDLATATTLPGSISQRNYERNGFWVAYTKAILVR
jgi:GNAT superfamily N-acetyltransferase